MVRKQKRAALADMARARYHHGLGSRHLKSAAEDRTLREDPGAALQPAASAGGLKVIEARVGTGKSYALAAIRDAHRKAT